MWRVGAMNGCSNQAFYAMPSGGCIGIRGVNNNGNGVLAWRRLSRWRLIASTDGYW